MRPSLQLRDEEEVLQEETWLKKGVDEYICQQLRWIEGEREERSKGKTGEECTWCL